MITGMFPFQICDFGLARMWDPHEQLAMTHEVSELW